MGPARSWLCHLFGIPGALTGGVGLSHSGKLFPDYLMHHAAMTLSTQTGHQEPPTRPTCSGALACAAPVVCLAPTAISFRWSAVADSGAAPAIVLSPKQPGPSALLSETLPVISYVVLLHGE